LIIAVITIAGMEIAGSQVGAQIVPQDFLKPRLVLNGQGHTASLRVLTFSPDGKSLLSGGLDKVVHLWEFREGQPRLDSTIRPPIYRKGGWIYALALSPVTDAQQQRLLAIAGYGVSGPAGDILIYRVPGLNNRGTGDLAIHLPSGSMADPMERRQGHAGVVFGLAFSPNGRYLASCGEDTTIRIWDLAVLNKPTSKPLLGHAGEVARVVFQSNELVISGGGYADGALRVWNTHAERPLVTMVFPREEDRKVPIDARINALVVSPDGRYVVLGRENGSLERYDAPSLANGVIFNPDYATHKRAVEALAYSPDGKLLASSVLKYSTPRAEVARTECDVALHSMPEGPLTRVVMTASDLVRALAFSPDGRFLAIGGGGAQSITVRDLQAGPNQMPLELKGQGTVIWNVAFADNRPTIAYARQRAIAPAPWTWEAFDLSQRRFVPVTNPDGLQRAVENYQGWTVGADPDPALHLFRLNVVPPQGQPVPIALDSNEDLRWMSYTFIPPNPAASHPSLALGVGTLSGSIVIHRLPDGQRTRVFSGHSGAVYGLAPSADGRWLASASADQTVRLWTLAGCDVRPPLGATFERNAQGVFNVKEVAHRGFAEQMGLLPGDRIDQCSRSVVDRQVPIAPDALIREIDTIAPGMPIAIVANRGGQPAQFQTTRRDSPVLSLFLGSDHEWVIWMPEGYYDTSIAGDRRLLGWHVNKGVAMPPEFHPMSRYEAQLRKPPIIDTLLRTADAVGAIGAVGALSPPEVVPPPTIRIVAPLPVTAGGEIEVQQPSLDLRVEVVGTQDRPVRSLVVRNGSVRYPPRLFNPPALREEVPFQIKLQRDQNAISMVATDNQGVERVQVIRVRLKVFPEQEKPEIPEHPLSIAPRLVVRSIGIEKFHDRNIPEIKFAALDARKLASFLVAPADKKRFREDRIDSQVIYEPGATSREIFNIFEGLAGKIRDRTLGAGDSVFLIIESHVLNVGPGASLVVGANADIKNIKNEASVPAGAISERLEEVASAGCLVLLFLDGIHEPVPGLPRSTAIGEWIRDLNRRSVFVFLASKQEPSIPLNQIGAFAQAILDSVTIAGRVPRPGEPRGGVSPTLDDFQAAVVNRVRELTQRRQFADFYPPEYFDRTISEIQIFEPQRAPVESVVRR
jgi:WD40 repeat protein